MTDQPTLAPLIGSWRTTGEVLGEDGATVVATIDGTDDYEWLGPTVVHRADVRMGDDRTRVLEIFEPYDDAIGAFPTRAYDDKGGVEAATATVDAAGRFHVRAGAGAAVLEAAGDGATMTARWTVTAADGTERPWMRLHFRRQG